MPARRRTCSTPLHVAFSQNDYRECERSVLCYRFTSFGRVSSIKMTNDTVRWRRSAAVSQLLPVGVFESPLAVQLPCNRYRNDDDRRPGRMVPGKRFTEYEPRKRKDGTITKPHPNRTFKFDGALSSLQYETWSRGSTPMWSIVAFHKSKVTRPIGNAVSESAVASLDDDVAQS
ncbi:hypothetical protein EVAR_40889_1 [Eumeta japonica]|uniref:Uncharacterized protein n=1 Tax=Eumeta variegata TaxID=151549 RepID=A0A4C1X8M5_EUMVA|nr:hypothetical protein EVAR_40889_1 [Eumeta japonica]